jgi:diguanylate cyclase (GGDEF)-like protein
MEERPGFRLKDLRRQIRALEDRDFRVTAMYLAVLSLVAVWYAWLFMKGRPMDPRFREAFFYGTLALAAVINIQAFRQRRAISKSREGFMREVEKLDTAEKLSLLDPLTGTFNARYLDRMIPAEKSRADRAETNLSFVVTTLEEYEQATVAFGAQTGERIIKELAEMLKTVFRPTDTIVRYGIEMFLIVMPSTGKNGAMVAVKRLMERVDAWNRAVTIPGYQMKLSFGYEGYTHKTDIWEAIANAKQHASLYRERTLSSSREPGAGE